MTDLFKINFKNEDVIKIQNKIKEFNWSKISSSKTWEMGTNPEKLKELCEYWIDEYDWFTDQDYLNSFNQYKSDVDDLKLHFILEKGIGKNNYPLVLLHGWPGSFSEFHNIIPMLTENSSNISFDVIAPSLPGFGFSDKPNEPIGPRKMAYYINKLLVDVLGYKNYFAQGGDWGSYIAAWLGFDYPKNCKGIHVNMMGFRHVNGTQNEEEKKWEDDFELNVELQKGYMTQKATKPLTLAYSMVDNPVGVAAWIIEKFHGWSDIKDNDLFSTFTKDELLRNIMIYLLTNTFESSSWIYYGRRLEGGRIFSNNPSTRVETPTACSLFPKEFLKWPPKSYVERIYNVKQWTEMPRGGHFAALEEPSLLSNDIKTFFKKLV